MKSDIKKKTKTKTKAKAKVKNSINTHPQLPGVNEGDATASNSYARKKAIIKSLLEKSVKNDIPFKVLVEVFKRGVFLWEDTSKLDKVQTGFNRVNSFINGGLARKLDSDLLEENNSLLKRIRTQVIKNDR